MLAWHRLLLHPSSPRLGQPPRRPRAARPFDVSMSPTTTTMTVWRRHAARRRNHRAGIEGSGLSPRHGDFNEDPDVLAPLPCACSLPRRCPVQTSGFGTADGTGDARRTESPEPIGSTAHTPKNSSHSRRRSFRPRKEPRLRPSGGDFTEAARVPPPEGCIGTMCRRRPTARLCIAKQNSRRPPSSAALRPVEVQDRVRPRQLIAMKAAMAWPLSDKGTPPSP